MLKPITSQFTAVTRMAILPPIKVPPMEARPLRTLVTKASRQMVHTRLVPRTVKVLHQTVLQAIMFTPTRPHLAASTTKVLPVISLRLPLMENLQLMLMALRAMSCLRSLALTVTVPSPLTLSPSL